MLKEWDVLDLKEAAAREAVRPIYGIAVTDDPSVC
jgi:hypothetical protein